MAIYLTPLEALEAALKQAALDHDARCERATHGTHANFDAAIDASALTYNCEVDAAHAVYGAAVAAMTRRLMLCDRAAYEDRHGTLDSGLIAFRADDAATARAELMAEVV